MWARRRFQQRRLEGFLLLLGSTYLVAWSIGRFINLRLGVESSVLNLAVGLGVLIAFASTVAYLGIRNRYRRQRAIRLADVDHMNGLEFEAYVCRLMEGQGYKVENVRGSGDFGVDITATRNGIRYAVQVKRQQSGVSRRAISDAVAGKYHFNCDAAMVVTNNYFTSGAKKFAKSTGCELVDRDILADWIVAFQRG
jgi:restriction system protein